MSDLTRIGTTGLHALQYTIRLDGRFSLYADTSRGYTSGNLYLFVGEARALLIDTGYGSYEQQAIEDVSALVPAGMPLELFPLRWSEINSTCNVRAFIEAFDVEIIYGIGPATLRGMEVRPRLGAPLIQTGRGGRDPMMSIIRDNPQTMELGAGWSIEILDTPFRLLSTRWIYEPRSRTMLTSDTFSHGIRQDEAGPWTITADNDPTGVNDVREHMYGSRYWWVPGADTSGIRAELRTLWSNYEIERIAPAFGCMIEGKQAVARHFELVLDALGESRP